MASCSLRLSSCGKRGCETGKAMGKNMEVVKQFKNNSTGEDPRPYPRPFKKRVWTWWNCMEWIAHMSRAILPNCSISWSNVTSFSCPEPERNWPSDSSVLPRKPAATWSHSLLTLADANNGRLCPQTVAIILTWGYIAEDNGVPLASKVWSSLNWG